MFDKISICQLNCLLAVAVIVLIIYRGNNKSHFDTSVAVRSQVGDATNLNTMLGPGDPLLDVYRCGKGKAIDAANPWMFDKLNRRTVSQAPDPSGVEFMKSNMDGSLAARNDINSPYYTSIAQDAVFNSSNRSTMADGGFYINPQTNQIEKLAVDLVDGAYRTGRDGTSGFSTNPYLGEDFTENQLFDTEKGY